METHRILAAAVATVILSPAANADVAMALSANRTYYQTNAFNLRFDGGELDLLFVDGAFAYDATCPLNGSPAFYPPSEIPPCQIGATGFVASGDLDGDGVRDDSSYWSITDIQPALVVEPSRPELCELMAGPPSKLPRPLDAFKDETRVVFYNIRTPAVSQYDLTQYHLERPYGPGTGELRRMNEEIVTGQYVFTFPRLTMPDLNPVAYAVTIAPTLNALDPGNRTQAGFRFTTGSWSNEFYQMDPRLINRIRWTGNDRTIVRAGDQIYFSILDPTESSIEFPPTVPQNPVLLANPTVQTYNMPPFFFVVGDEGVMNLEYNRFLRSSGVSFDSSDRDFRAKVIFVDSFNGFAQSVLPTGTPKRDRSYKGDVDHDGMTNGDEFAFDQITNEHVNASAKAQFPFPGQLEIVNPPLPVPRPPGTIPAGAEYYTLISTSPPPMTNPNEKPAGPVGPYLDAENHVVFEVPIRPRTGSTVKYQFQQYFPNQRKGQKLKFDGSWTLETVTETVTETHTIQWEYIDPDFLTRTTGQDEVDVEIEVSKYVLRSAEPVVDPLAELPDIRVQVTPTALK